MRTTLSLDDDLYSSLERLSQARGLPLRETVNQALRSGLRQLDPPPAAPAFRLPVARTGTPRVADIDDIEGLLSGLEGAQRP